MKTCMKYYETILEIIFGRSIGESDERGFIKKSLYAKGSINIQITTADYSSKIKINLPILKTIMTAFVSNSNVAFTLHLQVRSNSYKLAQIFIKYFAQCGRKIVSYFFTLRLVNKNLTSENKL